MFLKVLELDHIHKIMFLKLNFFPILDMATLAYAVCFWYVLVLVKVSRSNNNINMILAHLSNLVTNLPIQQISTQVQPDPQPLCWDPSDPPPQQCSANQGRGGGKATPLKKGLWGLEWPPP